MPLSSGQAGVADDWRTNPVIPAVPPARQFTAWLLRCTLLALLLAGAHLPGRAQNPMPLVYQLRGSTLLQECNAAGKDTLRIQLVPSGAIFTIVNPVATNGNYIIRLSPWPLPESIPRDLRLLPRDAKTAGSADTYQQADGRELVVTPAQRQKIRTSYYFNLNYDAATGSARYFLISQSQLAASATPLLPRLSPIVGSLFIPFKFRPQGKGDITKDPTLGGVGGALYRFRRVSNLSLAAMLGLGLTSVTLTSQNSLVAKDSDRSAVTFSVTTLLQWQQLQVGVVGGWDVLGTGASDDNWDYNKKFWLGAGIGVNIFQPDTPAKKAPNNVGIGPDDL